jgi:uncharacterized protein YerC
MRVRQDVADMLRAGATYREIKAQLQVGHATIAATRKALRIEPVRRPLAELTDDEKRARVEQRHPRVVAMLRAGASPRTISAETGVSQPTIVNVRRVLGIPAPAHGRRARTIAETLARYLQPYGDQHARWTGPFANNQPQLWANSRVYSARREAFRAHHGRAPESRLTTTCEEPGCIAGQHLADQRLLNEQHLDTLYTAIFGPENP